MEFIDVLFIFAGVVIGVFNVIIFFKAWKAFNNINYYFRVKETPQTRLKKSYYSPHSNFDLELYQVIYESLRFDEDYTSTYNYWKKYCADNNWTFPKQFEDCVEWGDFKKKFLR